MNALDVSQNRYTCKAYNPNARLDDDVRQRLLDSLRLTPSSVNIQPWQFLVARDESAKSKITKAMTGDHAHNVPKVMNADTVIVMAYKDIDDAHIKAVMDCEAAAGRFANEDAKNTRTQFCLTHINALNADEKTVWLQHQLYIALGQLLALAQLEGVHATPIEGFDKAVLNEVLDLKKLGCHSLLVVALGVASEDDFNAKLPKARFDNAQILTYL